jgi:hypothetical protein
MDDDDDSGIDQVLKSPNLGAGMPETSSIVPLTGQNRNN